MTVNKILYCPDEHQDDKTVSFESKESILTSISYIAWSGMINEVPHSWRDKLSKVYLKPVLKHN